MHIDVYMCVQQQCMMRTEAEAARTLRSCMQAHPPEAYSSKEKELHPKHPTSTVQGDKQRRLLYTFVVVLVAGCMF